jgi:hypothetical protein
MNRSIRVIGAFFCAADVQADVTSVFFAQSLMAI